PYDWRALDCMALHCNQQHLTEGDAIAIKKAGYGFLCLAVYGPVPPRARAGPGGLGRGLPGDRRPWADRTGLRVASAAGEEFLDRGDEARIGRLNPRLEAQDLAAVAVDQV